jgi:hypothetical protein
VSNITVVSATQVTATFTIAATATTGGGNVTITVGSLSSAASANSTFTVNPAPAAPDTVLQISEGATTVTGFYTNHPKPAGVRVTVTLGEDAANGTTDVTTATPDSTGKFTAILAQPLSVESKVHIAGAAADQSTGTPAEYNVGPSAFDWGRVRAYFTFGIVLSANQTSGTGASATANPFSTTSASPFISFDLDKDWLLKPRLRFNTFFNARLTEIGSSSLSSTSSVSALLTNQQAGSLQVGAYIPLVVARWDFRDHPSSLYAAPLAKAGFYTAGGNGNPNVTPVNPSDFYKFYGFGARVGHYREYRYWDGTLRSGRAPEQLSYMDFLVGRWDNFEYADPLNWNTSATMNSNPAPPCNVQATNPAMANCYLRERPWRFGFEGLLHVPNTPFVLGLSANIAAEHPRGSFLAPADDLRFLIGVRFDSKTLLAPLTALKGPSQ